MLTPEQVATIREKYGLADDYSVLTLQARSRMTDYDTLVDFLELCIEIDRRKGYGDPFGDTLDFMARVCTPVPITNEAIAWGLSEITRLGLK